MATKSNLGRRRTAALHEKNNPSYLEKHQEVVSTAAGIFLEKGYEGTKLKDISDRVGMDRATLYYYASSKKELFDEVLKNASEKNVSYIEGLVTQDIPSAEKLSQAVMGLMESYSSDYPYLAIFLQQYLQSTSDKSGGMVQESGAWGRRYYDALHAIIQEGLDKGEFEFSLPVGVATNAVIGMVNWIQLAKGPHAGRVKSSSETDSDAVLRREVFRFILKSLSK